MIYVILFVVAAVCTIGILALVSCGIGLWLYRSYPSWFVFRYATIPSIVYRGFDTLVNPVPETARMARLQIKNALVSDNQDLAQVWRGYEVLNTTLHGLSDFGSQPVRPNITSCYEDDYVDYRYSCYDNSYTHYLRVLYSRFTVLIIPRIFGVVLCRLRLERLVGDIVNLLMGLLGNDGEHDVNVRIHRPTVQHSLLILSNYLDTSFKNFRMHMSHRPCPAERSFFFCQEVIPKILLHLKSRIEYQVDNQNLLPTASVIVLEFLYRFNHPLPCMHPENSFVTDDCVFFRSLLIEKLEDLEENHYSQILHLLAPYLVKRMDFCSATAGSVCVDSLSTALMH